MTFFKNSDINLCHSDPMYDTILAPSPVLVPHKLHYQSYILAHVDIATTFQSRKIHNAFIGKVILLFTKLNLHGVLP